MSVEKLLSVLADGELHSGEEFGELLGVSRAAVWKQLKKLDDLGVSLESIKGRGYRLPGGLDLLSAKRIYASLPEAALPLLTELELMMQVDSTNSRAMARAADSVPSGYVCAAEQQTAGRGRRGRPWQSPFAANLYFSINWRFTGGAAVLEGLSLAVGVAVVEALACAGVTGLELKWPNDILCHGKKLAGILLEMTGDAAGPCQVVVGIGVNINMPESAAGQIDQPWADLRSLGAGLPCRSDLLATMLGGVLPLLGDFERKGFSTYREAFERLDAFSNRPVFLHLGGEVVVGTVIGVDDRGSILLDTATGKRSFNGGEVSLRSAE